MNLLAFDSATSACSAAVWRDGVVLARESATMARGQSEALVPMIARVMAAAGMDFAALDRLAVTVGPGAFTGLRIGLAVARGLALAQALPVSGVTTLEAIASAVPPASRKRAVLAVVDAKRDDVYAQLFDSDLKPLGQPRALLPEALPGVLALAPGPVVAAGDGVGRVREILAAGDPDIGFAESPAFPDAAVVATIAAGRADNADELPAEPLYLRPPQAVRPAHGGRLRP